MAPLIFCYYTFGAYEREAERLKASVNLWGLEAKYLPINNLASWSHAVMAKPKLILETLESTKRDILYVDADAEFMRVPDWKQLDHIDVGWHEFKRSKHADLEYLTGTMYFRYSPDVLAFVRDWSIATLDYAWSSTPEQASLKATWAKWSDRLIKRALGPEWTFVFDDFLEIYPGVTPTILHHQASRRLRK